ncbi:hypothetical protein CVT25_001099, partial [Psilocybe cyanescens]
LEAATRSRSSTCTSNPRGDTPPLSASDGSPISGGSQSSIDLSHINITLSNATHPMSTVTRNNVRAHAYVQGAGHRRQYSKSHVSRSSVYETIEDEMLNSNRTGPAYSVTFKKSSASPTSRQLVLIVDSNTAAELLFSKHREVRPNHGPLPYELRPHLIRSRTWSRPSSYPQGCATLIQDVALSGKEVIDDHHR